MPAVSSAPPGSPCWIDLASSDLEKAKEFYSQVFGWTAVDAGEEYGHYHNFSKGDALVAGVMQNSPDSGYPDGWTVYLASDDANATAEAATDAGGQVALEPMQVMGLGSMAVLSDAGGAMIGIWQPGEHKGFEVVEEAGAPTWFELHTRDFAKTVPFYEQALGWKTSVTGDTDEFRYTVLQEGGKQYAGIMDASKFLPEGVPAHWSVYIGTDDIDATLRRIEESGGSIVMPAENTPYGRLATAADPTGAVFKLRQ
ncbi:VOC family protein [Saxibacter everestensis]|uniref:VOC family protein n=1 Tax=Saxibacter everestensis TaxID=2909229 RepID=A0ABY8QUR2_9MICO|nr:VOC family protein [Brevibacteriaceae bacterium ZFBP1038]